MEWYGVELVIHKELSKLMGHCERLREIGGDWKRCPEYNKGYQLCCDCDNEGISTPYMFFKYFGLEG